MAQLVAKRHPKSAPQRKIYPQIRNFNRPGTPSHAMDPGTIASALIAARIGQAQVAVAARLMRQAESVDTAQVLQLLAAANQSGEALAAAVQQGIGEIVDIYT